LRVLEEAGLVVTRRSGREKLHFLDPVPIRLIHDRWIDKYTERQVSALADLKNEEEGSRASPGRSSRVGPASPGSP
jgi:DNA-binding transcriptional ArsR family regulator